MCFVFLLSYNIIQECLCVDYLVNIAAYIWNRKSFNQSIRICTNNMVFDQITAYALISAH